MEHPSDRKRKRKPLGNLFGNDPQPTSDTSSATPSSPFKRNCKRKPLGNLFGNDPQSTSGTSSATPSSPVKRTKMLEDFQKSVRQNWPAMQAVPITIRADSIYRTYATGQDPKALFDKATRYLQTVKDSRTPKQQAILVERLHESIIHAIFGSNKIERAGLGLDVTVHLCRKILRGEPVPEIEERDPHYELELAELYDLDHTLHHENRQHVLRGRREIVQHVRAFQHIIHHFVVLREDMTEDLIKKTHAILYKGVSIIDTELPEVPSEEYAGKYRDVWVSAGDTTFVAPELVPAKMTEMCADMKKEIDDCEAQGSIDPFSIASKYSLEFVQIHPFEDGNGRMCRMILNAILFRYAGIVVPIGEREEERDEYLDIKVRASEKMEGHGEYATFVLKKGMTSIRWLKRKLRSKKKS